MWINYIQLLFFGYKGHALSLVDVLPHAHSLSASCFDCSLACWCFVCSLSDKEHVHKCYIRHHNGMPVVFHPDPCCNHPSTHCCHQVKGGDHKVQNHRHKPFLRKSSYHTESVSYKVFDPYIQFAKIKIKRVSQQQDNQALFGTTALDEYATRSPPTYYTQCSTHTPSILPSS